MHRWTLAVATVLSLFAFAAPAFATVSNVTADITTPSAGAGARTVYKVGFTTSVALSGTNTVTVNVPGTTAPGWQGGTLRDVTRNVDVGSCTNPNANQVSTCSFFSSAFINAGDQVLVTLRGVTNGTAAANKTVSVSTTIDTNPVSSPNFAVVSGNSISTPTVEIATPSAATGARTNYVIAFNVSGTGGLSADAGSTITVNVPGTTAPGWQGGTVRDITRNLDVATCTNPHATQVSTCTFFSSGLVNPGDQLQITLRGITNGSAGTRTASVSTTSDLPTVASSNYTVITGNSISTPTVEIATPSAATGARTNYVIAFNVSGTGGLSADAGSTITVNVPGTTAPGWQGGTVRDITRNLDVATCTNPHATQVSTCTFFSSGLVNPGDQLQITLRGITNGSAGTRTASVSTTSDLPTVASSNYTVITGNSISTPTVEIATPSAATGARTNYVIAFNVSGTGGLSADAGSTITVNVPGTTAPGWQGGTVRDITRNLDVATCTNPHATQVSTCTFFSSGLVNPGDQLQITLRGITNGTAGTRTASVSTTSDLPTVASGNYTVIAGNSISTPTVEIATPSAATGARTNYVIGFNVSGTGGLSADAGSTITVNVPGTTAPGWQGGTVRDITRNLNVATCTNPHATQVSTCTFFSSGLVNPGDQLQITLRGITNGTAGTRTASVSTTSDLPTVASSNYTVITGNSITTPTVEIATPSAATGARTNYVIAFNVSGTGGLSADAGSTITVNLPGTTAPGWQGGTVRDITRNLDVATCTNPHATQVSTCTFFSSGLVNPGDQLQITLRGITNGTAGTRTASVSTTSDLPTVASSNYTVIAGNALTGVAAQVGSMAPQAATNYVVLMRTSATGGLSAAAGSAIQLTLPAGTTFTGYNNGTVHDVDRAVNVGTCGSPSGLVITCAFFSNGFVNAGDTLRITFPRITNPPSAPPYALTATTTSDTPAVSSGSYTAGTPTAPETTIDSAAVNADTGQFVFSSSEGGSGFECRIDGGAFFACTSPYTTPSLAGGEHRFDVRAVGTGGPDLTPATRSFVVAPPPTPTPTAIATVSPTPTATPTPEPTPQFKQNVVVEPVSGTVRVCPKGGQCFTLGAGQRIPLGSEVDTKKGVVELTSLPAPGKPPQTARFSEGIFRITQSAKTTDLTLTEPLAPCSKKPRASAKKAKTRKLWGNGKGTFRTAGKYSAATVRGTEWLVQDSCAGTLTRVKQGVVEVRDNVKKRTVVVRAGKSYTAKPKR